MKKSKDCPSGYSPTRFSGEGNGEEPDYEYIMQMVWVKLEENPRYSKALLGEIMEMLILEFDVTSFSSLDKSDYPDFLIELNKL